MYFDWVDAIRRMANSSADNGKDWALAMFFAIADYAEDGTLPEHPFIDMAISGYLHTLESDSEKYWKQVDGSHKGGQKSAEKRQQQAQQEDAAAAQPSLIDTAAATYGSVFVDTAEGQKPLNVPKDKRNKALQFADDVHSGRTPKPQGGGTLLLAAFAAWEKGQ